MNTGQAADAVAAAKAARRAAIRAEVASWPPLTAEQQALIRSIVLQTRAEQQANNKRTA